jgi:hypothetical protein
MEIEIIKTSAISNKLSTTKDFGIILNQITSMIKMSHWYAKDYNSHVILGDLYDDLTELFDKLQEEIIGTVNSNDSVLFPMFNGIDLSNNSELSNNDYNSIVVYHNTVEAIQNILTSIEFKNYVTSVKSGINNTVEDILSRINKTNYLLSLIKNI